MKDFYKNPWLISLVVVIAFIMRLINFTEGLGLDEIWSMITSGAGKSTMDIIDACKTDTHPPFFDLLLHYFILLIGDTEYAGRILSLLIGMLSIAATYYYVKRISNDMLSAFIALVIISFSFFHITFSAQGRFYTLLYILSLAVIAQLYLYLKDKRSKDLITFTIASIILIYTHYYGAILIFTVSILVGLLWFSKKVKAREFLYFCLAGVVITLAYAPWIPYMLSNKGVDSWMNKPNIGYFFEYLYNYTGKNPLEFLFVFVALILSIKLFKKNVLLYTLLFGTIFLGFFIPFLISYFSVPMLHFRYTFIYYPSLIIISSIYWGESQLLIIKKRNILFTVVLASVIVNFFFINDYIKGSNRPWRDAAEYIAKSSNANDIVYSEQFFHMNYYLDRNGLSTSSSPEDILADRFWYFHTTFDKIEFDFSKSHNTEEVIDYTGGYVLTYYVLRYN